ncbi:hypothetical protein BGAL_0421g00110 [Botrytis galanthina]|uniref:Uncharacterized protein n=1 Tax=Botrytis galanthina TaxID=278940 RepID=A0A4S8QM99_9HELO|nr:hypothetical protein BGAL_0421g00110 [Botrytis galanthina]
MDAPVALLAIKRKEGMFLVSLDAKIDATATATAHAHAHAHAYATLDVLCESSHRTTGTTKRKR